MKKIIIYAANGVSLGHLRRVSLLAKELKGNKKILVTSSKFPDIFGKFYDKNINLLPLSDKLQKNPRKILQARLSNAKKFIKIIKEENPNLIVSDIFLDSFFTFFPLEKILKNSSLKSVLIWRIGGSKDVANKLENIRNSKLNYFQKIILPYAKRELKDLLPLKTFRILENDNRFKITGPIFNKPEKNNIETCRQKYKISNSTFLITVSMGGGGASKIRQCDNPKKIVKVFFLAYNRLKKHIPNLKVVIVTGPYSEPSKNIFSDIKLVKFEKHLSELFCLSGIVISSAGYNTCLELANAKTPSILFPLLRGGYEQHERASHYSKIGISHMLKKDLSPRDVFNAVMEVRNNLDKIKKNFKYLNVDQGNKKAAHEILSVLNS